MTSPAARCGSGDMTSAIEASFYVDEAALARISRARSSTNQAASAPSTPIATGYARRPRGFTCAEAGDPTIWA